MSAAGAGEGHTAPVSPVQFQTTGTDNCKTPAGRNQFICMRHSSFCSDNRHAACIIGASIVKSDPCSDVLSEDHSEAGVWTAKWRENVGSYDEREKEPAAWHDAFKPLWNDHNGLIPRKKPSAKKTMGFFLKKVGAAGFELPFCLLILAGLRASVTSTNGT
jgi:hypothetical protein